MVAIEKFASDPEKFISKQFSNLFSSYTQAFNKEQGRMGSLFMKGFKRKSVTEEGYLKKLVHYIHYNPVEAGLCTGADQWKHSSYHEILSGMNNRVKAGEVISWFEDVKGYIDFHKLSPQLEDEF